MDFILDASIALSWCFKDERSSATDDLLESLGKRSAWVPNIWPLEITNIMVLAQRHQRITYAEMTQFLELLTHLPITIDHETSSKAFHEILSIAHSEKITSYDAAYLELAMRKGLPLASKDKALCLSAKHLGVSTLI